MDLGPKGFDLLAGLMMGLLGALLWLNVSIFSSSQSRLSLINNLGLNLPVNVVPYLGKFLIVLWAAGIAVMVSGPLWFWLGRPIYFWRKERQTQNKGKGEPD